MSVSTRTPLELHLVHNIPVAVEDLDFPGAKTITDREVLTVVRDAGDITVFTSRSLRYGKLQRSVAKVLCRLLDHYEEAAVIDCLIPSVGLRFPPTCNVRIFAPFHLVGQMRCVVSVSGLQLILSECDLDPMRLLEDDPTQRLRPFDKTKKDRKRKRKIDDRGVVCTQLFLHQKEAVEWMASREDCWTLPPFWREDKVGRSTAYTNVLTKEVTGKRPEPLRGGILNDEKGLGKTLTLISLISLNHQSAPAKRSSTLIVCHHSSIPVWAAEFEQHTKTGSLKFYVYHGRRGGGSRLQNRQYDVVITDYKTLAMEWQDSAPDTPLHRLEWLRVILDDAHVFKKSAAFPPECVIELNGELRWIVTGENLEKMKSSNVFFLMNFFGYQPFCTQSFWRRFVMKRGKIKLCGFEDLLHTISLRRKKESGKLIGVLPQKIMQTHYVNFSPREYEKYYELERKADNVVEVLWAMRRRWCLKAPHSLVSSVQQVCNDMAFFPLDFQPDPVSSIDAKLEGAILSNHAVIDKLNSILQVGDEIECSMCLFSPILEIVISSCCHVFCRGCMHKIFAEERCKMTKDGIRSSCPVCCNSLGISDVYQAPPHLVAKLRKPPPTSTKLTSSKVSAFLKLLHDQKDGIENPHIMGKVKSVVISQFPKVLAALEEPIKAAGFHVFRLNGSMGTKKRADVMKEFGAAGSSSAPRLLLAGMKSPSRLTELKNLTAASGIILYLLEPWKDPGDVEQLIDWGYHVGQKGDVHVVQFIMKNSIEERVLRIQEKKKRERREGLLAAERRAPRLRVQQIMADVMIMRSMVHRRENWFFPAGCTSIFIPDANFK